MSDKVLTTLESVFGFKELRQGQEEVITRLLEGESVLAIFPTGGGKSLCYQLPALLLDGLTVVISPLIALMKDQIDFLVNHGVQAARLDSSLDFIQTRQVYQDLNAGRLKLLYISPERLGNERFLQSLPRWNLTLLAIDEVHCVSAWGHNFRPDYMKIATLAKQLKIPHVLGLTATATADVAQDIASAFEIKNNNIVQTGFYRPNLHLNVTAAETEQRKEQLLQSIRSRPHEPTIVYVTLQKTAMEVAGFLVHHGLNAQPYHAGLKSEVRHAIQESFMASNRMIVVATIAFGMGIDKANIRAIYHYNLPKGLESYAQEIGRAGRDGQESICSLFASREDVITLENFTYGDTPTFEAVASILDHLLNLGPIFDVSIYDLSFNYDIRILVVRTLLAYLELDNIIQSMGSFYTEYRFQPLKPIQHIFARFDHNRASFLQSVFHQARQGSIWFSLDIDKVSFTIGQPRERITAALTYLEQQGDLRLKAEGVKQGYRLLDEARMDRNRLKEKLYDRFQKREEQDINRLQKMLEFTVHDGCLTHYLLTYFGEQREKCGHCSLCQGGKVCHLPDVVHRSLGQNDKTTLLQLYSEGHRALATPRQLTRFLCGLTSPATSRARLRGHPLFGTWKEIPFHQILDYVTRQHALFSQMGS